jgi:hypothetical protein
VRYGASYLASEWWAEVRARFNADPNTPHACAVCGTPRYQLHHRTYERLGAERLSDLLPLCSTHHEALHRAWTTHQRYRPDDTLAGFTDAWVVIKRRAFPTAPLPALDLYRGPDRPRDPVARDDDRARRGTDPVLEGIGRSKF